MKENKGDLISREALKISFKEHCCGECDCCVHQKEGFSCELIDNAPTVNPEMPIFSEVWYQERPQGEWINKRTIKHDGEFYCSNCDFELESFIQGAFYNFCPNCGASMKKGGAE